LYLASGEFQVSGATLLNKLLTLYAVVFKLILNPSEQSAAKVEALEKIASMICEPSLRETTCCKQYEQTAFGIKQQPGYL